MHADHSTANRHLRVIHACEKGATGVYWGHRVVAALLFRDIVPQLSQMHGHEMEHFALFGSLMKRRNVRHVIAPVFWCAGGIVYGFVTALGGRRAVWKSTAVIEGIVERELLEAAAFFEENDSEAHAAVHKILSDELQHKQLGELQSQGQGRLDAVVGSVAQAGAVASKKLAEKLYWGPSVKRTAQGERNDLVIPVLPSRSLANTISFYQRLGFHGHMAGDSYAILTLGGLEVHFFPHAELQPATSFAGCYARVTNAEVLYESFASAKLPKSGIPRMEALEDKPWGMKEFAVVDEDGNLLRIGQVL